MMHKIRFIYFLLLLAIGGCDLDKEIEVDVPDFEPGYVVEAYVMPGHTFGMLITKSFGYFDVFDSTMAYEDQLPKMLVEEVEGSLFLNGKEYKIHNQYRIFGENPMIYNYTLGDRIRFHPKDEIDIELTFPTGEKVTAKTQIPETRPIDSVSLISNDRGEVRSQTYFTSDPDEKEYFRRQLFRIREGRIAILQDFVSDNRIASDGKMVFGSGYDFEEGDTLHSRITHITAEYFNFFNSINGSIGANSNPFSQPGKIKSNIRGSDRVIGIFTGMNTSEESRDISDK